jgi:hypothetical protein
MLKPTKKRGRETCERQTITTSNAGFIIGFFDNIIEQRRGEN